MKTKIFLLLILVTGFLFPQIRPHVPFQESNSNFLYSEMNVFPDRGNGLVYFYSYRIPYDRLVFVKTDGGYQAKFTLSIEVTDTLGNFIDRQIKEDKINVREYKETDSDQKFYQGLITFKLAKGNYYFTPIITDINSNDETRLRKIDILANTDKYNILFPPVIINSKKEICGSTETDILGNYEGFIPFNSNSYDLIIPSTDTTLYSLHVVILCDDDTVLNNKLNESSVYNINLQECDSLVILRNNGEATPTRNFLIKGLSPRLHEGNLIILCFRNDLKKPFVTYYRQCHWFDKPFSLMNPEFAIKILKYFASEAEIDKLLDAKEKDYPKELNNFWKKYDPTPTTQYNELMSEYYKRVDYTAKNFSSLSGKKGFETDRGKVYIQFGKPKTIERGSNSEGKVVETWYYNDQKKFIFIDKQGTGDFPLQKE